MWISRAHFALIADAATQFRAYHEQIVRDKDQIIRSQEARLGQMEQERRELVERLVARDEKRNQMVALPEPEPDSWEEIMRAQIRQIDEVEKKRETD
jgi:hypothetical protein